MSLQKYRHVLKALSEGDKTTTIIVLKGKTPVDLFIRVCPQHLAGKHPTRCHTEEKVEKYKKELKLLRKKSSKEKEKKKALQKGGFLPALLAPILTSVVAPLVSKILK